MQPDDKPDDRYPSYLDADSRDYRRRRRGNPRDSWLDTDPAIYDHRRTLERFAGQGRPPQPRRPPMPTGQLLLIGLLALILVLLMVILSRGAAGPVRKIQTPTAIVIPAP